MAVYTQLSDAQVAQLLGICDDIGELVAVEGVAAGSINSVFKVTTTARVFYLRVNEGKAMADLVYERDLLAHLLRQREALGGVVVPELVRNSIGGMFFKVDEGKFAMLFEELGGRELAVFEVTPSHTAQLGAFLGRFHRAVADFGGARPNPYRAEVVAGWLEGLQPQLTSTDDRALFAKLQRAFSEVQAARVACPLPAGVIHGDLFINNSKWRQDQLLSVFDWEMAGDDHLVLDLAITLLAWCWRRQATPDAPDDHLDPALTAALVAGYEQERPLTDEEREGLYGETRFGALRFCASRVRDFHVPHHTGDGPERDFLDYRDFERRLDALEQMGAPGFAALCGLDRQPSRRPASTAPDR